MPKDSKTQLTKVYPSKIYYAADDYVVANAFPGSPYSKEGFDPHQYYTDWEDQFRSQADNATPLEIITDLVMSMDFKLDGKENDVNVVRWEAFKKKIRLTTKIRKAYMDRLWGGNGFLPIVKDNTNEFGISLQELHPKNVYPNADTFNRLVGWFYIYYIGTSRNLINARMNKISESAFAPSDMMHIAGTRIGADIEGMPLIAQAYDAIKDKNRLEKILGPMAAIATHGLIHTKTDVSDLNSELDPTTGQSEQEKKITGVNLLMRDRVQYDEDTGETRFNINISTDNKTEMVSLPLQTDIPGLVQAIEDRRKKINMSTRVYQVFLGYPEDANRATAYVQLIPFVRFLEAEWRKIADELEDKLFPQLGITGTLYFETVIKDDQLKFAQIIGMMDAIKQNGGIDNEELRGMINEYMDENLDPKKKIKSPAKTYPLGTIPIKMPEETDGGDGNPGEDLKPAGEPAGDKIKGAMAKTPIRPVLPEAEKIFSIQKIDGYTNQAELKFKLEYINVVDILRREINDYARTGKTDYSLSGDDLEKVIFDHSIKVYIDAQEQLKGMFKEVNRQAKADEREKLIAETAKNDATQTVNTLESETKRIIIEGMGLGKSPDEMVDDLENLYPDYTGAQLDTIARTVVMDNYNQGRFDLADKSQGFVTGWYYNAILDLRTTDICRTLNGLYFKADDPLIDRIRPPNHWNCRSIMTPITMIDNTMDVNWSDATEFQDIPQEGFK